MHLQCVATLQHTLSITAITKTCVDQIRGLKIDKKN